MLQLFPYVTTTPLREHGLSMSIPAKNEESVGIIFALNRQDCENHWISGRQKPGATRMRTERLKKTVGLHVYQITKTKKYKFK